MNESLDIRDLLVAISRVPEGRRTRGRVWYESQKEHWIGWLLDNQGGDCTLWRRHGTDCIERCTLVPSHSRKP